MTTERMTWRERQGFEMTGDRLAASKLAALHAIDPESPRGRELFGPPPPPKETDD